jgi:hypothetical protein
MLFVTVVSGRPEVKDELFELESPPRIGEVIQTAGMPAARVQDVTWHLATKRVTVYAG